MCCLLGSFILKATFYQSAVTTFYQHIKDYDMMILIRQAGLGMQALNQRRRICHTCGEGNKLKSEQQTHVLVIYQSNIITNFTPS